MKKTFTLFGVIMVLALFSRAQEVILLTGETFPEKIIYHEFVEWAISEGKIADWYVDFGDGKFTTWADNPSKDGINKTDKALFMETTKGPDWWGNFLNFRLDESITITEETRYLHIYHYRENLTDGWSFSLNTDTPLNDPDRGTLRFDGNNNQAGRWEDIVIDLKHLIENEIKLDKFMVIVDKDWNGPRDNPPSKYYFDEIVLSSDPFPRGVVFLTGTDLLNFQSEEQLEELIIATQHESNTFQVIDNPYTESGVNTTSKVGHYFKSNESSWWQGFHVVFPGIHQIEYGEKQYLHVLVKAEIDCFIQLHIIDNTDAHHSEMFFYPYSELDGEWFDLVWDLSSYSAIKALTVRFDVRIDDDSNFINGTPEGNFWVDELAIDNNPYEREEVLSVRRNSFIHELKTFTRDNTIYFESPDAANVDVFDLMGRKISSSKLNGSPELFKIEVPHSGIYILRVSDINGKLSVGKVLVR